MNTADIKWGILAAGNIAGAFATAIKECPGSTVHAVASRELDRAQGFADAHGIPRAYGDYESLLADPEVAAVYIATVHPLHLEWISRALHAGKHVLCEKPLVMNLREAKRAQKIAVDKRCLLREAFMYRYHPQTQKAADLVSAGAIGSVRMIEADFCFDSGTAPESRLQAKALGGGAILDVGCYTMSFARLIAGRARGRLFAEPLELKAVGHLDPQTKTDMWTTAVLRFEGDILAKLTCAVRMKSPNSVRILGDQGHIEVESPWFCRGAIRVEADGKAVEVIEADTSRNLYAYEIEAFTGEISGRPIGAASVGMRFDDSLGNIKALDWWRSEIGLGYEADRVDVRH